MKKVIFLSVIAILVLWAAALVMEPKASGAVAASTGVTVNETVDAEITLSVNNATVNLGNMGGMTGGALSSALSPTIWTVITNNASGWKLEVVGNNSGKLQKGAGGANKEFTAYTLAAGLPTLNWVDPAAGVSEYGFAVTASSGANAYVTDRYFDDASVCGDSGRTNIGNCYDNLAASREIGRRTAPSALTGDTVTMNFKTDMTPQSGYYLESGLYSSTVTGTATTLP